MKPFLVLAVLCVVAGCDSMAGAESRYPGVLLRGDAFYETIAAPDTVVAGRPFAVAVFTVGGGCFQQGDEEVVVGSRDAVIRPFDVFVDPGPGGACTADLAYYPHTVAFAFGEPGVGTIRAVGSVAGGGFGPPPTGAPLVTVERTVVVVAP